MNVTVAIPPVDRDDRIGSVLNEVFSIIYQTDNAGIDESHKVFWDFSECRFLHPFFLGILSVLKRRYADRVECVNISTEIAGYLDAIYFHNPLQILPESADQRLWVRYNAKTYIPICSFSPSDASSTLAQELVQGVVLNQLPHNRHIRGILSLLLGELVDNITDHSKSEHGYIFTQYHKRDNCLYAFICDTGRSIYSSYAMNENYADQLSEVESSALLLAVSGRSTKNRPEAENRGYGISKSRSLIVNGLHGEFYILSGTSFFRHDINGEVIVDLPEDVRWDGTMVLLKIPNVIPPDFNLYNYIS